MSYNGAIAGLAQTYDLALVDANAEFAKIKADGGILFGGANYSTTFVTGGLFSLDGVHPTQKGYAVVANLFIDAINAHYGSSIPKVDINEYPGVALP